MNDESAVRVHSSFLAIGVVALVWNLMGGMNFFIQMTNAEMVASMSEVHRVIIEDRPVWVTAGMAFSVFGGAIGAVLLLFKKSAAIYVFVVSLVGTIVTMGHTLALGLEISPFDAFMMVLMPIVFAAFLVWYSKWAEKKGWIG